MEEQEVDAVEQHDEPFSELSEIENDNSEEVTQEQEDDGLPEKFKGKSAKDVYKSYSELEKELGRLRSETGAMRKILQDVSSKQNQRTEVSDDEFFVSPSEAIRKTLEPDLQEIREVSAKLKQNEALSRLSSKHNDWQDVIPSQEFQDWVQASPVRMRLYMEAHSRFDADSAIELLDTFKERQVIKKSKEVDDTNSAQRDTEKKAAKVPSTSGSSENRGKKIYNQQEIIQLQIRDPQRYKALLPEIMKAYREGRVR